MTLVRLNGVLVWLTPEGIEPVTYADGERAS